MKIRINPYDKSSITDAIKQLQRYEREFREKETEFVRRLKELGVTVATTGFELADYDGENDVLITETQLGGRALVIAYGETVGFIEFGTGVKFKEYDSSGLEFTPPAHGTYGKGRGASPKGWWFSQAPGNSRHTFGNAPAEAMRTARDTMIEQVTRIAREVWK